MKKKSKRSAPGIKKGARVKPEATEKMEKQKTTQSTDTDFLGDAQFQ